MTPGVFLDLNGTLVQPVVVDRLSDHAIIAGAPSAVARLNRSGLRTPVVTIQSRIAKGTFSLEEFMEWFQRVARDFAREGAKLEGPYVCPHRFAEPCPCKKPSTLLYERASRDSEIDLAASFTIGDTGADVEAAHAFGGLGCLVLTGYAAREQPSDVRPDFVGNDLHQVADWIVARAAA
jgi:histidinol-phosphate phosphatase family protein